MSEKKQSNTVILEGNEFLLVIAGNTRRGSRKKDWGEYGDYQVREHYTVLGGDGQIRSNGETVLEFALEAVSKVPGAICDSGKPESVRDVFSHDNATDKKDYTDAVARYIIDMAADAASDSPSFTNSDHPVHVDADGRVSINMLGFRINLEPHLQAQGILPEPSGQYSIRQP